ncbi:MAG: bifunctional 3,4-dihydroxy-2-butanone-4-phosphate synthase/GTP cyclohydrolase [Herbinix sp.]|jgi:3,4-dihydroxy 2-butanone 4-phosphate synthase/GTP cyclohydrolase II|nr:bifunctional 3,4-dihydroxy-2-butanone-4-phosphate synthase/GTP cyclohydrolase [Herbinix sp.]
MTVKLHDVVEEVKKNNIVVITDDDQAQNGGVFFAASVLATKENINYMMKHGTGFTCISLPAEKIEQITMPQINPYGNYNSPHAYLLSVDDVNVDGITAQDRELTIRSLLQNPVDHNHFKTPGHVFVMKAANGGVLKKAGYAEAASDLANIAGCYPSGTFTEVLSDSGEVLKAEQLLAFAEREGFQVITIEELIAYRRETDCYVIREAEANLPTEYGDFRMVGFVNRLNGEHHVALVKGTINEEDEVLVRVHSECLTGDAFHSLKCDCGEQLAAALQNIEQEGKGVLLYLRQEGRGIGLINKIKAYKLQEEGMDTEEANIALGFPADMRDYGIGAQILSELKVRKIRLMTNNPKKLVGLKGHGIEIVERVPIIMDTNMHNKKYFDTKKEKMGHLY